MIAFFLILATIIFAAIAALTGYWAYRATHEPDDPFGVMSMIGMFLFAICFLSSLLAGLGFLAARERFRATPVEVRADEGGSFDAWMSEHCKTCKQCDESMNRNPDVGLCEVAFAKLQESLREAR